MPCSTPSIAPAGGIAKAWMQRSRDSKELARKTQQQQHERQGRGQSVRQQTPNRNSASGKTNDKPTSPAKDCRRDRPALSGSHGPLFAPKMSINMPVNLNTERIDAPTMRLEINELWSVVGPTRTNVLAHYRKHTHTHLHSILRLSLRNQQGDTRIRRDLDDDTSSRRQTA